MKVLIEIDPEQAAQWDTQAMGHVIAYAIKMAALGEPYARERGIGEVFVVPERLDWKESVG